MKSVITFEQAIAHTENLLNTDPIDDHELQQAIADLIATDNGARGFFVTYLTGDWAIADHPPESVIQALRYGSIYVFELLVKNLAMSTAMAITHRRQGHELQAKGSERVQKRTAQLIKLVNHPEILKIADVMRSSAELGTGEYVNFFQKWGYDQDQKSAIANILRNNN